MAFLLYLFSESGNIEIYISKKSIKKHMTIRKHVTHIKSSVVNEGKPKLPKATSLLEGEIAINFAADHETMAIVNSSGNVVTFSSDNVLSGTYSSATQVNAALAGKSDTGHTHVSSGVTAMTNYVKASTASAIATGDTLNQAIGKLEKYAEDLEAKFGSGFSVSSVTEVIEDDEKAISASLNDLNTRLSGHTEDETIHLTSGEKAIVSAITGNVGTMAYQNTSSYSSATQVNTALAGKSATGHTHASSGVTAMTSYAKASTASAIATGDTLNQAIGKLEKGLEVVSGSIQTEEITYADLKTLRNSSGLTPNKAYRIIDYTTTTTQNNTQSAGHQFDIIVTADDNHTLNENAKAIKHAGDTYFTNAGAKLEVWELKYCLDNDTDRFMWADTTNGKGVIYYMKDEWNNECSYDFKNIQFKRYPAHVLDEYSGVSETFEGEYVLSSLYDTRDAFNTYVLECIDYSVYAWRYTFHCLGSNSTDKDATLMNNNQGDRICMGNVIKEAHGYSDENDHLYGKIFLNDIVFYNEDENICIGNYIHYGCFNNTFLINSSYNRLEGNCYFNIFGNNCNNNTFGNDCYNNVLGDYFQRNTIGNSCHNNVFGNDFYDSTLGNSCSNITFKKGYCYNIIAENGNQYITLTSTANTSDVNVLRNITIAQGVNNTTTMKTISHNTVNDTFRTIYKPANSEEVTI